MRVVRLASAVRIKQALAPTADVLGPRFIRRRYGRALFSVLGGVARRDTP
jgi:hypothetical protein